MIAIHVGFAKTATSTLQRGVFSQHEGIDFLGLPARDGRLGAAIHAIAKADSVGFDTTQIRGVFRDSLKAARGRDVNLISYENFTLYESRDKGMIARRLKDLFGDSKILFTLRRQEDLVRAWYLQKLPKYMSGNNFIEFNDWIALKRQEPHKSIMGDLDFNETIGYYEEVFGRERVEIFLFEHLRQDPAGFAEKMAGYLEIDPARFSSLLAQAHYNPTITQRQLDFGRFTTAYLPRFLTSRSDRLVPRRLRRGFKRFLGRGPSAKPPPSDALDEWIASHCQSGNRALNARYGNQLARHGYTL
jgi:hypothetical protein